NHQGHYFPFATAERLVTITKRLQLRLLLEAHTAALQSALDRAQEHRGRKGLGEELDCSRFHCLNRHRDIAATCDEDNRHGRALAGDLLLKLETIEVRQTDIEDQATRGR